MALLRCNVCQGEYVDILPDGLRYFHTCPPLSAPELAAALVAERVTLSAREQFRLDAARVADAARPVPAGEPTREAQFMASLAVPRPGARDENVDPTKARGARDPAGSVARELVDASVQRAPGAGARVLADDDAV
jgi:hypothetical protein